MLVSPRASITALPLVIISLSLNALAFREPSAFNLAGIHPSDGMKGVSVGASLNLRFSKPVDVESLKHLTLHRIEKENSAEVRINRATDLTNASITLSPEKDLEPASVYEIRGSAMVKAKDGSALTPFRSQFTTVSKARAVDERLVFEPEQFDGTRSMTTVLFGPDRRLYAADAFGNLLRWDISSDGRPIKKQVLLSDSNKSRQYIDLEWDPAADADRLILWASYGERVAPKDDRYYFTGTVARFEIGHGIDQQVIVTGLPHGREVQGGFETLPHQPNGLVFKDGKLYQSVGATSSSGGPANWGLPEQMLSACILEIDVSRIREPLDVHPKTGYDANVPDAPVRIFATGVRNALEIVAHSNGHLYTATNINDRAGRGDGVPDDPDIAGDQNALIEHTTPNHESVYLLQRGRHYGFPNPARGQYVLNGGNPTHGVDAFEIPDYPVGTQPDDGFAPELMYQIWQHGGTSPNGMIEYMPTFPHSLRNALICCFYSAGDIAVIPLAADGMPTEVTKLRGPKGKLRFKGPLDITMDPSTGILYVADFGTQSKFGADGRLVLLRPATGP